MTDENPILPPTSAPGAETSHAPQAPSEQVPEQLQPAVGLSLTTFILGISTVILSPTVFFPIVLGLLSIVIGALGKKNEPNAPSWMTSMGITLGVIGLAICAVLIVTGRMFLKDWQ